jgi:hypothetical protein
MLQADRQNHSAASDAPLWRHGWRIARAIIFLVHIKAAMHGNYCD